MHDVKKGRTLKDLVIVELPEEIDEEQKVGDIVIAGDEHTKQSRAVHNTGTVVLVGPDVKGVKVGDRLKWLSLNAHPVRLYEDGDAKHVVMGEEEICYVYPPETGVVTPEDIRRERGQRGG